MPTACFKSGTATCQKLGPEPVHQIGKFENRDVLDHQPLTHRVARVTAPANVVAVNDTLLVRQQCRCW